MRVLCRIRAFCRKCQNRPIFSRCLPFTQSRSSRIRQIWASVFGGRAGKAEERPFPALRAFCVVRAPPPPPISFRAVPSRGRSEWPVLRQQRAGAGVSHLSASSRIPFTPPWRLRDGPCSIRSLECTSLCHPVARPETARMSGDADPVDRLGTRRERSHWQKLPWQ